MYRLNGLLFKTTKTADTAHVQSHTATNHLLIYVLDMKFAPLFTLLIILHQTIDWTDLDERCVKFP